jgi:ABC-type antimicrobial peptide transport system permease subunit
MALGADRRSVIALVLRGALGLIVAGLAIGLPLSLAGAQYLERELYGMNPYDPAVFGIAVVALGLSALVASLIPAFRASSISPLDALRTE